MASSDTPRENTPPEVSGTDSPQGPIDHLSAVMRALDMHEQRPLRVLSLGGGTQSCALALMSAAGDLPKLDHVVFADTQGELPETYEYLDYLRPIVETAGIGFHIVTAGNLEAALLGERMAANPTPPAHVLNPDGTKGRINGYKCSYDFKRRQIERKVKALCGDRGAWKRTTIEQWIGFSIDEESRKRVSNGCRCGHLSAKHGEDRTCQKCDCARFAPWLTNRWPLIEMRMRREDTIRWFRDHGHPTPPRSACWFCPNSRNERWQELKITHPDYFERACRLDEAIRNVTDFRNRANAALDGSLFLHDSLTPLRLADLTVSDQAIASAVQGTLDFEPGVECRGEVCFT